jgi:hypothetical protein
VHVSICTTSNSIFPEATTHTQPSSGAWQRRGAAKMKEAEDTKKTQRKILERKESLNQKGWHLFFPGLVLISIPLIFDVQLSWPNSNVKGNFGEWVEGKNYTFSTKLNQNRGSKLAKR